MVSNANLKRQTQARVNAQQPTDKLAAVLDNDFWQRLAARVLQAGILNLIPAVIEQLHVSTLAAKVQRYRTREAKSTEICIAKKCDLLPIGSY